jgi:HEPN pEK499 p136
MSYITDDFIKEFAKRTIENLKFIEEKARFDKQNGSPESIYGVTQLINSLLGIFVLVHENHNNHPWLESISKTSLVSAGITIKLFQKKRNGEPDIANLRELIEMMRHSTAHFNIKTHRDKQDKDQVGSITMTSKDPGNRGIIIWEATLTVDELRNLVKKVAKIIQ